MSDDTIENLRKPYQVIVKVVDVNTGRDIGPPSKAWGRQSIGSLRYVLQRCGVGADDIKRIVAAIDAPVVDIVQ